MVLKTVMQIRSFEKVAHHLKAGHVYRRENLAPYSKSIDRDLKRLSSDGVLEVVAPGLYHVPKKSNFGNLPPKDEVLVRAFLRDDDFLLLSWNEYNALGLGLTQLYNHTVVYNRKRHGVFELGGKRFDFRRPHYGFPKKLTPAFLLMDLFNNLTELAEQDPELLQQSIRSLPSDLLKQAAQQAKKYGKVATKKFFAEFE